MVNGLRGLAREEIDGWSLFTVAVRGVLVCQCFVGGWFDFTLARWMFRLRIPTPGLAAVALCRMRGTYEKRAITTVFGRSRGGDGVPIAHQDERGNILGVGMEDSPRSRRGSNQVCTCHRFDGANTHRV